MVSRLKSSGTILSIQKILIHIIIKITYQSLGHEFCRGIEFVDCFVGFQSTIYNLLSNGQDLPTVIRKIKLPKFSLNSVLHEIFVELLMVSCLHEIEVHCHHV